MTFQILYKFSFEVFFELIFFNILKFSKILKFKNEFLIVIHYALSIMYSVF